MNNSAIVPFFLAVLTSSRSAIRRDACWTLRNLRHDPRRVHPLTTLRISRVLARILSTDSDLAVRREAAWAISNAVNGRNLRQVHILARTGCIRALCDMLAPQGPDDPEVVRSALAALEAIFDAVRSHGPSPSRRRSATAVLALVRRESDGLQPALHELRVHSDSDIRERSIRMVEKMEAIRPAVCPWKSWELL
jgi:importin subunit alpha-6/7